MSIEVTNDNNEVVERFETIDDMFEAMDERWEKKHPFLNWFDNMMYEKFGESKWFYFGYSPHVLLIDQRSILKQLSYEIKWAWQRVVDGVDERASWGVCYWLNETMPKVLRRSILNRHGVPITFYNNPEDTSTESQTEAIRRYEKVMLDLLKGFEEMKELEDFDTTKYPDIETAISEFQKKEKEAKNKLHLLIDYYWEIGD